MSLPTDNDFSSTLQTPIPNPEDTGGDFDTNRVFSDPIPLDADPLIPYAWHLNNTGQSVFSASAGAPGADLNLQSSWAKGILGKNVKVMVSDDGVESTHEDISDNFSGANESKNYLTGGWISNVAPPGNSDFHGTSVAGLIGAVAGNGKGSRGVAPKVTLIATNFMSNAVSKTFDKIADQARGPMDIVNMSWGAPQSAYTPITPAFEDQLAFGVLNGRNKLGVLYVRSAGNSRLEQITNSVNDIRIGNANFDGNNTTPYSINIGALYASGVLAAYSSPGSNVWVSAPAGEDGMASPAMLTTDRSGCSRGYSGSSVSSALAGLGLGFLVGQNGNDNCNYTFTFNGTSSAAPNVSGALALILEANPKLNWRDVKYIIAKTATDAAADLDQSENYLYLKNPTRFANHRSPAGYKWDDGWVNTKAGFRFNTLFGFGKMNVDGAVTMALSYKSLFTKPLVRAEFNSPMGSQAIPDFDANGAQNIISVSRDIKIEAIQVMPTINHGNAGELAIELFNPSNERSVLVPMNSSLDGTSGMNGYVFLTNRFFQESSVGNWKINVVDGRSGNQGNLVQWRLVIYGQE